MNFTSIEEINYNLEDVKEENNIPVCPECGSEIIVVGRCATCTECGFSLCSL